MMPRGTACHLSKLRLDRELVFVPWDDGFAHPQFFPVHDRFARSAVSL